MTLHFWQDFVYIGNRLLDEQIMILLFWSFSSDNFNDDNANVRNIDSDGNIDNKNVGSSDLSGEASIETIDAFMWDNKLRK